MTSWKKKIASIFLSGSYCFSIYSIVLPYPVEVITLFSLKTTNMYWDHCSSANKNIRFGKKTKQKQQKMLLQPNIVKETYLKVCKGQFFSFFKNQVSMQHYKLDLLL